MQKVEFTHWQSVNKTGLEFRICHKIGGMYIYLLSASKIHSTSLQAEYF